MTSQIILVNQAGVAVASDTVVTSGPHDKTLPVAEKITDLSGPDGIHKLVALTSGNPEVGNVRWSVLLREWILKSGAPCDNLNEYLSEFRDWAARFNRVPRFQVLSAKDVLCNRVTFIGQTLARQEPELKKALDEDFQADDTRLARELDRALADWCVKFTSYLTSEFSLYEDFPLPQAQAFVRQNEMKACCLDEFFQHVPGIPKMEEDKWTQSSELLEALLGASAVLLGIEPSGSDWYPTILAFAGFGDEEPIGGGIQFWSGGVFLGRAWGREFPRAPESGDTQPAVIYLAQQKAIADFVRGLDQSRRHDFISWALEAMEGSLGDSALPPEARDAFGEAYLGIMGESLGRGFEGPFFNTLGTLSLTPLLHLAEALVNLQALRASFGHGVATVGGRVQGVTVDRMHGVQFDQNPADGRASWL